jgi:GAF domain-containing protein
MNNDFSRDFSPSSAGPAVGGKRNLWQWLVEPLATITDAAERRQATLVSTLLLIVALAVTSGSFVTVFVLRDPVSARILVGMTIGLVIAYVFSRTKSYHLAVPLLLVSMAAWPVLSIITVKDYSSEGLLTTFMFDIFLIIISSTLTSFRTTLYISIANFLGILILPAIIPAVQFSNIAVPLIFNGAVSGLLIVMTRHRNLQERDRLADVDRINTSMQSINTTLNTRTHELALAAEVGRSVSQVRALDVMLKDAAELIRSRFDLYYVQVYLTNPSQTELRLQAGTGVVGAELAGRGHRLPVNAASINGRAAVEKRSVVISDTAASATFRPNPLLPDTRAEMAVPLLLGDVVVGVLDMQSNQAGALQEEMLPAFEALAGQIAVAIQNARLLSEAEQARTELELQARRLARANWAEYLDAIHKPEEVGFVFEQNQVAPEVRKEPAGENALVAPIAIVGEPLGNLVVELAGQAPIARTAELIDTVARQVAQQIENLRLLESAERYRLEAEDASRRLTHQGWQSYMAGKGEQFDYLYDLKEVVAGKGNEQAGKHALTLPIKVRDDAIGELALSDVDRSDRQSLELARAVTERLAAHIESLRQNDQTQSALTQSERLFAASSRLTQASDLQELVQAAASTLNIPVINRAVLTTFNYDANHELESLDIIANWWNGTGHEVTPAGTHYSLEVIRAMPFFISSTPVFFNDAYNDPRVDKVTLELVKRQNLNAVAVLPLHVGAEQIGALILEAEEAHNFTQDEIRLFQALAPQVATVLENRRQFERAQKQAERETMLNEIGQKIRSATSVDAVLQIAARELGHALGAPLTIAQLGMKDKK